MNTVIKTVIILSSAKIVMTGIKPLKILMTVLVTRRCRVFI